MGRPPGTTVFVGNISYDTTVEQLKEVFSQVGNVVNFRLMHDNETGRAKGYGFCEYEDKETAMSARRNLNGTMFNGRPLRVDFTDSDKQIAARNGPNVPANLPVTPNKPGAPDINQKAVHHLPHPHLQHAALPPGLASANPSMEMMSLPEIHRTMLHLKKAIVQNPNEMRDLLLTHPRLAQAVMQGQLMLGMVPPPMIPTNQPRPPMQQRPQPPQRQRQPPPPPRNQPPPPPPHVVVPPPPQNGLPPQPGMPLGGIPISGMPMAQGMDEPEAVLQRVMNMTQQEINQLPAVHRNYIFELKQILAMQGAGGMNPAMNPPVPPGIPPPGQAPPQPQQQFR